MSTDTATGKMVFDFRTAAQTDGWQIVNDDVMGGVSTSRFQMVNHGVAVLSGRVSLENNGGFASVRSLPSRHDLTGCDVLSVTMKLARWWLLDLFAQRLRRSALIPTRRERIGSRLTPGLAQKSASHPLPSQLHSYGLLLRVCGDGRSYKFSVGTETRFDTPLYQCAFGTKRGEGEEHRLPFTSLVPTFRGRVLAGVLPINPANVCSVGLLVADQQAGAFPLEIGGIKASCRMG